MADISYTSKATERKASPGVVFGKGDAGNIKILTSTIELASTSQNGTVKFGRIPSNARISLHSDVHWDDLATSGLPTLDIGLASVDSNVTSDADALNDGLDVTSASSSRIVKDLANIGKRAWEFVSGQTTDPGGELDVYGSIVDAGTNQTGTISLELLYTVD